MELILQFIVAGVTYGMMYAIVAIGFNIIYNTTGIINFAQGEFLVIGAMTAISLNAFMPMPLAILAAVITTMLVGALVEMVFIRWLDNPSVLRMIIITIGLSILMREVALHIWGESVRSLPYFSGDAGSSMKFFGARMSPQVLWVIGICSVIVIVLSIFFRYTMAGKQMSACSANRSAATLCGISASNMVTLSFALSAGIGALAGCAVSPIAYTQYNGGTVLAIKGFTVAILGGLGNSMAAVAAGLLLGILESFSVWVLPTAYKDAVSLLIMLFILFVRPSGIFGSRELSRLKEF